MSTDDLDVLKPAPERRLRKPRIALMGEFSAGKSTLLNMLLTRDPLPVRVTASNVPPVWITHGPEAAMRVMSDGTEMPFDPNHIDDVALEDTKFISLSLEADALEICDLFDMPGISDPNMSQEVWQDAFEHVDSVIWCTHATQAWRQSEAATWEELAERTNGNNILVITQFDKIRSERDQTRLLSRVKKETQGLFQRVFPLALIDAINAADEDSWRKSGAADFSEHLIEMLLQQVEDPDAAQADTPATHLACADTDTNAAPHPEKDQPPQSVEAEEDENRIIPRRVAPRDPTLRVRGQITSPDTTHV